MATNVTIPNLGDSISTVTLLRWIKNDGDFVRVDDPLAELETDKANTDLIATVAGVLHQMKKVGDVLKVGDTAASIDESAKASSPAATPTAARPPVASTAATRSTQPAQVQSTVAVPGAVPPLVAAEPPTSGLDDQNPSVRPLLIEHKLNPKDVPGSGPHGRLLKEDVLSYLEKRAANGKSVDSAPSAVSGPPHSSVPTSPVPIAPTNVAPAKSSSDKPAPGDYNSAGEARVAMSKIRSATAANLKKAQNTAAILTTFNEVDMFTIMDLRTRLKERFEKTHGVGLGFMSFFARAVVLGLREFPKINAYLDGNEVIYHNFVNLGVAVSSERGLAVPVLKHAELMSFAKIESEIKRLATAVRDNKLALSELSGGTFTITNGGVFGSLNSTPILNPPQSGILGMHAIVKRPIAIDDKVVIRPMMNIALSYDHRIVDGRDSVSFLVRVKEYLEDPARLMLEV